MGKESNAVLDDNCNLHSDLPVVSEHRYLAVVRKEMAEAGSRQSIPSDPKPLFRVLGEDGSLLC